MLSCDAVYDQLQACAVRFYCGVPDSLLKEFCACVADRSPADRHVIAANEGAAVGLAAGHYLATGDPALVYMQNSGLGNAVNPLMSLADRRVYGLPMVLMIGWRGQPGITDEPQHAAQGQATPALLDVLGVPYEILADDPDVAAHTIRGLVQRCRAEQGPCALLVPKGIFSGYRRSASAVPFPEALRRADAIEVVVRHAEPDALIIATTGHAGRELYEIRAADGAEACVDFLNVGAMGHASQIALAVALAHPQRRVYCLDGDGALIMHMGALAIIGQHAPANLVHVVLNNGVHDSVGAQPTAARGVDFPLLARACGYAHARTICDPEALTAGLAAARQAGGPSLLEVRCRPGARSGLGRPAGTPAQRKASLLGVLGA